MVGSFFYTKLQTDIPSINPDTNPTVAYNISLRSTLPVITNAMLWIDSQNLLDIEVFPADNKTISLFKTIIKKVNTPYNKKVDLGIK